MPPKVSILLALATFSWAEQFSGRVVAISDGDTVAVLRDKAQIRIRLHGIDCPEKDQPFGTRARQFTGDVAFNQNVIVLVRDRDRYGRTVRELILPDGRNLNHEIVRAGFAWWYRQYAPGDSVLQSLEQEARRANRGLWADDAPVEPGLWRKQENRRTSAPRQPARSERRSERRSQRRS